MKNYTLTNLQIYSFLSEKYSGVSFEKPDQTKPDLKESKP